MERYQEGLRPRGLPPGGLLGLSRLQDLRIRLHGERPRDRRRTPRTCSPVSFSGRQWKNRRPWSGTARAATAARAPAPGACAYPEVVRALREELGVASPFEKAFKGSVRIWGRVYEPYVFLMAVPFLVKEGYLKHMTRWIGVHEHPSAPQGAEVRDAGAPRTGEG